MFFTDLVLVLVISIVLTAAFAMGFRKQRLQFRLIFLFLLLFLATWAGGVWTKPFGPVIFSENFLSFLVVGIIVSMLLTAVLPPGQSRREMKEKKEAHDESCKIVMVDMLYLLLVVALAVLILVAYL